MGRLVRIKAGAIHWRVLPECRELLLDAAGLRLDEWVRTGRAAVIKHGPHRTVYRVTLPGLHFYLKHYRLSDYRARLRQLVRPSKARMEYDRALAVANRAVPTVYPLAVGEKAEGFGPGDSFLITRSLENTEPLSVFLEKSFPRLDRTRQTRFRQRLAKELGRLIALMHEAGMVHKDLHPANLLLEMSDDDRPRLHVIDLHAVRLGPRLDWAMSRANLVILNRWFLLRAGRCDRLRFWRAYCRARGMEVSRMRESVRDLETRTWQSNWVFWRSRDRRCLLSNRYYRRVRGPRTSGYAVTDVDADGLKELLADPDAPFRRPGATFLKYSRSSTVVEFDLVVGGRRTRVIYKRFRVCTWTDPWTALVRPTPALRSWMSGHGLRERGLPTPRPLAVFHRRRFGLAYEGYLLTEKIPGAVDLHGFVARLEHLAPARRRLIMWQTIDRIARLVRQLHQRRVSHRDLKASNILVRPDDTGEPTAASEDSPLAALASLAGFADLWLIDLVGVRNYRNLTRFRRIQNLARLNASFLQSPALSQSDRLRFLRVYLQWGVRGRLTWKRWWRAIAEATRLKVARNRRNGRPLA